MKKKDGEMDKDRDVPASSGLLNFPWGPTADAVPPTGPIETSSNSRATEGGGGGNVKPENEPGFGACGDCPACRALDYIDTHGDVVTEVVPLGEGVYLGPDDSYFDSSQYEVVMDWRKGIGVIAIDKNDPEAVAWWAEQENYVLTQELIKQLFGDIT